MGLLLQTPIILQTLLTPHPRRSRNHNGAQHNLHRREEIQRQHHKLHPPTRRPVRTPFSTSKPTPKALTSFPTTQRRPLPLQPHRPLLPPPPSLQPAPLLHLPLPAKLHNSRPLRLLHAPEPGAPPLRLPRVPAAGRGVCAAGAAGRDHAEQLRFGRVRGEGGVGVGGGQFFEGGVGEYGGGGCSLKIGGV